jgi:hypothetical protein
LKNGDDKETDDKKHALAYLEEAQKKKAEYIKKVVDSFEGNHVEKDPLVAKLKESFFSTSKLRMAITGRKIEPVAQSSAPVSQNAK